MLPHLGLNTTKAISHCWFAGVRADLNVLLKCFLNVLSAPRTEGSPAEFTLWLQSFAHNHQHQMFGISFSFLAGAGCSPAFISPRSPPCPATPPLPCPRPGHRASFSGNVSKLTFKHNSRCYFLPPVFRGSSMSSLRARKRSLITAAAAAARYNVKFLKCKCILENYSPLDLPPPPPLPTPRHESGAARWKSPGTCRCIIILSFVLLSLAKMRTIIIIGVFSLGI